MITCFFFFIKEKGLRGQRWTENALRHWLQKCREKLLPVGNEWPCSKVKEDCSTKMERGVKNIHAFLNVVVNLCESFTCTTCKQREIKWNRRHYLLTIEVEWIYSSTLSLNSALDGVDGQRWPQPLYPRYPLYNRLCGPQGRFGQVRIISPPTGDSIHGPSQPVASLCTDYAIPPQRELSYGPWKWIYFCDRDYILHVSAMLPSVPTFLICELRLPHV
jgi:hypothetical protein